MVATSDPPILDTELQIDGEQLLLSNQWLGESH